VLFSSQVFLLLFLPLTLAGYYLAAGSPVWRLRVLLLGSLVFYAYWDWRFLPVLVGSVVANWLMARFLFRSPLALLVWIGVAINLGLLGVFKYADFFAASLVTLIDMEHQPWSLVLPLGISFFTFQQIAYLVDLRRQGAPCYRFENYAAYVTFFPQLIAGPIVRHNELIPQFEASPLRTGVSERLSRGAVLLVLGLLKKVFFADELAPIADLGFDTIAHGGVIDAGQAWISALAYSLQLYFDFSSYSDMAIGLGLLFGFRLPINFDNPYRATSIRDFWRRWHITLSSFFRDYVYIPLGGSRQSKVGIAFAVLVTMLLCGLWHGAGWTIVVWGVLHGVAILVSRIWSSHGWQLPGLLSWAVTMLFVIGAWVLFRAADFSVAWQMLSTMVGGQGFAGAGVVGEHLVYVLIGALFAVIGVTNLEVAQSLWLARRSVAITAALGLVLVVLRVGQGRTLEFIYFQF
jgi:alginate O-acetyltransferase complex protein AlgI